MNPPESNDDISNLSGMLARWTWVCDAIEGMVAQLVARGFSEPQARDIVTGVIARPTTAGGGKPQ